MNYSKLTYLRLTLDASDALARLGLSGLLLFKCIRCCFDESVVLPLLGVTVVDEKVSIGRVLTGSLCQQTIIHISSNYYNNLFTHM